MPLSIRKLARIVQGFSGKRLAVAGDWMLDRYIWGTAARLSPEAPVPVVEFEREDFVLGGAGNVAVNLASLGAKVLPFGVTGRHIPSDKNDFASILRAKVQEQGMPGKGILADAERKTTVKTRLIAGHQQVVRVDRETRNPISGEIEEKLIRSIVASLRSVDAFVLSDYDKGVVTEELSARVLSACQKLKKPSFVKPKWSLLPKYPGATAVILNRKEAGFLVTHSLQDDAAIEAAGRSLLDHFGSPCVVITLGKDGLRVFEQDSPRSFAISATSHERPAGRVGHPAHAGGRQVFDVTGAGDTVLAAFALGVAAGASLRDAAVLANCAAGVVVGKLGTACVTQVELISALRDLA